MTGPTLPAIFMDFTGRFSILQKRFGARIHHTLRRRFQYGTVRAAGRCVYLSAWPIWQIQRSSQRVVAVTPLRLSTITLKAGLGTAFGTADLLRRCLGLEARPADVCQGNEKAVSRRPGR